MLMLTSLPLYFRCLFFDKKNRKVVSTYKIEPTGNQYFPFQLFKRIADGPFGWMHLSIYASVSDSLGILLKELFAAEHSDEVYRGQTSIDSTSIMEKLNGGQRTVAIYDETGNQVFRLEYDVSVEELLQRDALPRLQKRRRKIGTPNF